MNILKNYYNGVLLTLMLRYHITGGSNAVELGFHIFLF